MRINVVGFDPSLRNWGIATGTYDTVTKEIQIYHLGLVQPAIPTGKQVRQNSKDLESAAQLAKGALEVIQDAHAIFVEVPVGSQSSRAMASYGICVGVLGALRSQGTSFYEVTPSEVKLATVGKKTASKAEMIAWATQAFPSAPWPVYQQHGKQLISEAKAEHMADAIAAIKAGVQLTQFQQLISILR